MFPRIVSFGPAFSFFFPSTPRARAWSIQTTSTGECPGLLRPTAPPWCGAKYKRRLPVVQQTLDMDVARATLRACEWRGDDAGAHAQVAKMRQRGEKVDAECYVSAIGSCVKPRNAAVAKTLQKWMRDDGVPLRADACRRLAALHARRKDDVEMMELVKTMRKERVALEPTVATRACTLLGKKHRWKDGLHIMEWLESDDAAMDLRAYNAAVDACARAGRLDACLMLLLRMREAGLKPDKYTYTGVFHATAKAKCPEIALESLQQLKELELPDVHAYTALVEACGTAEDGRMAQEVWEEMKAAGVVPNSRTYACMIQACSTSENVLQAVRYFREWKDNLMMEDPELKKGPKSRLWLGKSSNYVVSAFVGVLGRRQAMQALQDLVTGLKEEKLVLDIVAYNHIMEVYSRSGDWKACISLLDTIETYGQTPDSLTFETLVKACLKAGDVDSALLVEKRMKKHGIQPNKKLYNWITQALCREGRCTHAMQLYGTMMAQDWVEYRTFHNIIKALAKGGFPFKAEEVLGMLRSKGMVPEPVSYALLIESFGKTGLFKEALRIFNGMSDAGCQPDIASYAAIIRACGYARDARKASFFFEDMQSKGLKPNTFTWNAMLTACSRSNEYRMAANLYKEFETYSTPHTKPNFWTYNLMINIYGKGGRLEEARALLHLMEDQGLPFDAATFNALMNAYVVHGRPEEAKNLFEMMSRKEIAPTAPTRTIMERADRMLE